MGVPFMGVSTRMLDSFQVFQHFPVALMKSPPKPLAPNSGGVARLAVPLRDTLSY